MGGLASGASSEGLALQEIEADVRRAGDRREARHVEYGHRNTLHYALLRETNVSRVPRSVNPGPVSGFTQQRPADEVLDIASGHRANRIASVEEPRHLDGVDTAEHFGCLPRNEGQHARLPVA
ncbi:hypothetical protein F0U60_31070 [Archangium minus]|uniref:Uncharacterized protein n=1 Tax=Archangium minus TaxID=83450 RepID=A0ABY9WY78_9BACT|nr:hypothetical protein F0U60_31070 [Archangium minus]